MKFNTPVLPMVIIQVLALIAVILAHRYLSYLWDGWRHCLNGMLCFLLAGAVCSFVDVVFWGGSLDFLRLFDWFTFDLKDVYLNAGALFLFLYCGAYFVKKDRKMSREERRQTGFWRWIRQGLPSSRAK